MRVGHIFTIKVFERLRYQKKLFAKVNFLKIDSFFGNIELKLDTII